MDYEEAYNQGPIDWSFPSPTATPTSATFNGTTSVCQTPKPSSFSHFQDAFSTPQMQGFTTPGQPEQSIMTPVQRPQTSSDIMHASHFANARASGGRVVVPGQFVPLHSGHDMSPMPITTPVLPSNAPPLPHQPAAAFSFDTSHMQTPPPTRGASTKKNVSSQQIAFGTPSTITSRRFATPQQQLPPHGPSVASQLSPAQLPEMPPPPDSYQFDDFGPASAPVLMPSQILWGSPHVYQQTPMLDDPFAPLSARDTSWPSPSFVTNGPQSVAFQTPEMRSFPTHAPLPRLAPAIPAGPDMTQPPLPGTMPEGVNPSLVYSSPVRPVETVKPRISAARGRASHEELRQVSNIAADHARSETLSSVDSVRSVPPRGLRRNNTTGTADLVKAQASFRASEGSVRNIGLSVPRTASPLKRAGRHPLGSISESKKIRPRASIVLTVDENGRARAETRPLDESPTRNMRDRYPGLFDSDSSDAESETSEQPLSRSASFSFNRGEERRSKAARLEAPVENLEGLSIPRTASSNSIKVSPSRAALAAAAALRRDGSVRKRTGSRNNHRRMGNSASSPVENSSATLEPELVSAVGSFASQRRQSFKQSRHRHGPSLNHQGSQSELSETQQSDHSGFPVRCTCGLNNTAGQPLIQCCSCTLWVHCICAGANTSMHTPDFTCYFCSTVAPDAARPKPRRF